MVNLKYGFILEILFTVKTLFLILWHYIEILNRNDFELGMP